MYILIVVLFNTLNPTPAVLVHSSYPNKTVCEAHIIATEGHSDKYPSVRKAAFCISVADLVSE